MQAIIPGLLEEIGTKFGKRPDLVLHAWPEIIGERLAPMTRALSFHGGVLQVKVNSSTLYSLLSGSEKAKMVEKLRKLFPSIEIKNILFKMG